MGIKIRTILILAWIYFFEFAGIFFVLPIFAPVLLNPKGIFLPVEATHLTRTMTLGSLIAIEGLSQFFSGPILGDLSDHIGRKKVIFFGLCVGILAYLCSGLSFTFNHIWLLF